MKLVIERDRWFRGCGEAGSFLLAGGQMCCLGFFGLACGNTEGDILDAPTPDDTECSWPEWLVSCDSGYPKKNSRICNELMAVNDDRTIDDARREEALTEIFAKHSVEVEFR